MTNKKDKKIAFLGNMNNMPFSFANEVKKRGYDVTFYVHSDPKYTLDRPECLDNSISYPYPSWIKEKPASENLNVLNLPYLPFIKHKYLKLIEKADTVVLNGDWVSLGGYIKDKNKKVIVVLAGDDLDVKADYRNVNKFAFHAANKVKILFVIYPILILVSAFMIWQQRKGIRRSSAVNYFPLGIIPHADKILEGIMEGKDYDRLELRGIPFRDILYKEFREKNHFFILNFTRFLFKDLQSPDNKRNDIMIEGIAKFIKNNNIQKNQLRIVFFEKGREVADAKELIDKLGITEFIEWLKPVSQSDLKRYIEDCDVAFDQLGNQWIGYGVIPMAMGRPLIANGRPEIFEKLTNEISPVCQATNAEEVAEHLEYLFKNPSKKVEIGKNCRKYAIEHYDIEKTVNFLTS